MHSHQIYNITAIWSVGFWRRKKSGKSEEKLGEPNVFSKFSAPTIAFLAFWLAKNSNYEPIVGVLCHMENSVASLKIFSPDAL